jgi:hypothetical protein
MTSVKLNTVDVLKTVTTLPEVTIVRAALASIQRMMGKFAQVNLPCIIGAFTSFRHCNFRFRHRKVGFVPPWHSVIVAKN